MHAVIKWVTQDKTMQHPDNLGNINIQDNLNKIKLFTDLQGLQIFQNVRNKGQKDLIKIHTCVLFVEHKWHPWNMTLAFWHNA